MVPIPHKTELPPEHRARLSAEGGAEDNRGSTDQQAPYTGNTGSLDSHQKLETRLSVTSAGSGSGLALLNLDSLRRLSMSPFSEFVGQPPHSTRRRQPRSLCLEGDDGGDGNLKHRPWHHRLKAAASAHLARFWSRQRAVVLVGAAQFFGVSMNLCARLLEVRGGRAGSIHPVQLLFLRMSITVLFSNAYILLRQVPHFPLGPPGVRRALLLRGLAGFVGIYGMWQSILYLPLAEATVIGFLVPCVSGYMCQVLLGDPFTRREQVASFIALGGVVLIARPAALFGGWSSDPGGGPGPLDPPVAGVTAGISNSNNNSSSSSMTEAIGGGGAPEEVEVTPAQRLGAIAIALVGMMCTSAALSAIRWIGPRAHPLISVNYFTTTCTLITGLVLALAPVLDVGQPDLRFGLPGDPWQWFLLVMICICGFLTQFCVTAGLGAERSNRAMAMVYTGMVFAAAFDRLVFGLEMEVTSLLGCGLIIGSAMWAMLPKQMGGAAPVAMATACERRDADPEAAGTRLEGEAIPMLRAEGEEESEQEQEDHDNDDDRGHGLPTR